MDKWSFRAFARNFARLIRKAQGMKDLSPDPRPGDNATPQDVLVLANQYRSAFENLRRPKGAAAKALIAPAHLCAIHAIELYLHALLRQEGTPYPALRDHHHKLADMVTYECVAELNLRTKTIQHLKTMTDSREYVVVRYAPEMKHKRSNPTQVEATLKDIADKVIERFTPSGS